MQSVVFCRAGVLVWLVAAGLFAVVVVIPGAGALDRPGTVQITGVTKRHAHVDVGRGGRSPGDIDSYNELLYNKRITARSIGRADMLCMAVSAAAQSCTATYFLPRGEIVVQGVISSHLIYELAVVGGTGLYDNVRGTLTATSLGQQPARELLVFRLLV
jgi:hypothetical protein